MAFWDKAALQLQQFRPGMLSKAEIGENLIMVYMQIGKEMEDSGHVHPFDQCGIILSGQIEMFTGQKRLILKADDCYFIPAGERHGWKTFAEPVTLFDVSAKPSA